MKHKDLFHINIFGYIMYCSSCYSVVFAIAIGLLFQPLGEDGVEWSSIKLYFNLYTGPGFLGAILSIINILMVIFLFKEYNLQGIKRRLHLSRLCCYCVYKGEEHRPLIDREVNGELCMDSLHTLKVRFCIMHDNLYKIIS